MIGTKLAHYEITSHLGTGGMGEVYQASDSKLGRSVAIKLLPEAFAHDPERAARLEREARVLASLNHPRIAAIYGIEESGGRKFLVMELVSGQTLADRIERGPLPIDEALGIASQIAEALEAAHEKGVIHRDLKPANIKVSVDGQVKVLDFGLAKAFTNEPSEASLANSPTVMSAAATNAGIIMGTAAYMSPEQARGLPVDTRSDIFAFGCVLYEMLAGIPQFEGDTVSDILAGVLKSDPDWSRLPADTPPHVRRLLDRCLRKDRRRRLQTFVDVRNEIQDAVMEPGEKTPEVVPRAPARRAWIPWAAALGALALAAALAVPYFRPPSVPQELRLDVTTLSTDDTTAFAMSPDGRYLAFVGDGNGAQQLWLRSMDSLNARVVPGTEGASNPFWSPNSKSIGFSANGKLMRVDIGAGQPQLLAAAGGLRGSTWGDAGVIVYTPSNSAPLYRIPESPGGTPVPVTRLDKLHSSHRFPSFLPNGKQFLFLVIGTGDAGGIYLGSLDSTDSKFLTNADSAGVYLEPGWLLFLRQGTLVARQLDASTGVLVGDPVVVADSVASEPTLGVGAFSASRTGIVAYRSGTAAQRQLTWFDRTGKVVGVLGESDHGGQAAPVLAPDEKRAALFRTEQGNTDVYVLDGVRSNRITSEPSLDRYPVWSHDGRRIIFDSNRKGRRHLFWGFADRSGGEEVLLESDEDKVPNDVSSDGRYLLYLVLSPESGADLWILPMDEKGKTGQPRIFQKTMFEERQAQFSPDGTWVAYQSTESGAGYEIYVRPFSGPGGQYKISTGGGVQPRWRRDGKELYYVAPDGNLMAVTIEQAGNALTLGKPTRLFHTRLWGGGSNAVTNQQYSVARDGRFLMNVNADGTRSSPITLLLNWKPPVK
jgi:eukaryotic-like serine/threonine-protein kinase